MIIIIIIIIIIIFFSDLLQMITYQKSFSSVAICLFVVLMLAKFEDPFVW